MHLTQVFASFAGLLKPDGQLILAGDPKQLGPVVRSPEAITAGLGRSILERLMDTNPSEEYAHSPATFPQTGGYNPAYVTKLLHCYRSHQRIIELPNRLFYDNELIPNAGYIATTLLRWQYLPVQGFPVIFHGVEGENQREGNSPSWFNVEEIEIVLDYIIKLQESQRSLTARNSIAVITPYRQQVKKIKRALALDPRTRAAADSVACGSCEQMQGQEFQVVIISTVRSDSGLLLQDARFNLGFVSSPKRFNVAVTRAQALLIVIGDPRVLRLDPNWLEMMQFCANNNSYFGASLRAEANDANESSEDDDDDDDYDMLDTEGEELNAEVERITLVDR
jgi:helicase MOV-10